MTCVEQYLQNVESGLVCVDGKKKRILQQLSSDVADFAEQHSDAVSMDALEAEFGTPQEVAKACLSHEDVSVVKKQLEKKKIIIISVLGAIAAVLIVFFSYLAFDNARKEEFINGYDKATVVYDEQEIPEHIENIPKSATVH